VLEIDAASNNGIDNVRDVIIDGINIIPARDRYKVFIIDEVHQLSKPAFNALLKTLEEPPPKVVFIMATTELHKVPDTILSRTQEFEFRTIPLLKIFDRLKLIADAEKIDVSDDALREIARSGEGSMRDAQSNFDQVISFAGERIEATDVASALGLASVENLTRVLDSLANREPASVLAVVDDLSSRGQDLRNFCRDLLGLLRDLLVTKVGSPELCEMSMLSAAELASGAQTFSESDLVRLFHSLAETESRIKDATQPRYMLEIGLVKLVEMRRLTALESVLERLSQLESGSSGGAVKSKAATAPQIESSIPASAEKKTLKADIEPSPVAETVPAPANQPVERVSSGSLASDLEFLKSMPVRLPPIPSEELEHVDDPWLDQAYELKLARSGDGLSHIAGVAAWAAKLVSETANANVSASVATNGSSPTAAAVAIALAETENAVEAVDVVIPDLPADPTAQDLKAYALAHPAVKNALKVFRGKITAVRPAAPKD
jgi:DNA polymerase-3 subunit gamma/tau